MPARRSWDWEPWEARRRRLPKRVEADVREVRQDARLLVMVVRARFAEGVVPLEHAGALGRVAEDKRVNVRQRRVAATLLGRIRLSAIAGATGTAATPRTECGAHTGS